MLCRTSIACVLALAALGSPAAASAAPRLGEPLPSFHARDLSGDVHDSREIAGRPTLVVAIASPSAGGGARRWLEAAAARYQGRLRYLGVVALKLPFFATWSMAASHARPQVPSEYWRDTWLDRAGDLQSTLELEDGSSAPYVLALDGRGRVIARLHGELDPGLSSWLWAWLDHTK